MHGGLIGKIMAFETTSPVVTHIGHMHEQELV